MPAGYQRHVIRHVRLQGQTGSARRGRAWWIGCAENPLPEVLGGLLLAEPRTWSRARRFRLTRRRICDWPGLSFCSKSQFERDATRDSPGDLGSSPGSKHAPRGVSSSSSVDGNMSTWREVRPTGHRIAMRPTDKHVERPFWANGLSE
jgi:hypothetical protein